MKKPSKPVPPKAAQPLEPKQLENIHGGIQIPIIKPTTGGSGS